MDSINSEAPLKLPRRPTDPMPGVCLSGIGGGALPGGIIFVNDGLVDNGTGGASLTGLPPCDDTEAREVDFGIGGLQTFCNFDLLLKI